MPCPLTACCFDRREGAPATYFLDVALYSYTYQVQLAERNPPCTDLKKIICTWQWTPGRAQPWQV